MVAAFARQDIDLIIEPNPQRLTETDVVTFDPSSLANCVGPSVSRFFTDVKTAANFDPRRRWVYHYAVFGHHATCTNSGGALCSSCPNDPLTGLPPPFGSPGTAERPGNDFIIAMGETYFGPFASPRTLENEAGPIRHELGHNLGLHHGGSAATPEGKPNYYSVMNRNFQFIGITSPTLGTRIDYSNETLPTLDENALVESAGANEAAGDDPTHEFRITRRLGPTSK